MHFVSERWLGGTLTNLAAIRGQVKKLDSLEIMERDGTMARFNKKQISGHNRLKRRIVRNLEGIRAMDNLPTAMVIVDPHKEHIAVGEAFRLRVPIIAVLDTDCDPDPVDIPIPANDDAVRSIDFILNVLGNAINEGRLAGGYPVPKEAAAVAEAVEA
jgi:small subunit ribosomal protein S2